MKYPHTNRSGVAFVFLNFITLGISSCVVLSQVRKEYRRLALGSANVEKLPPYFGIYLLGWLTLGIVPLVWVAKLSRGIEALAKEKGISKPHFTSTYVVLWIVLGSFILIGPFLAYHRLFVVLNYLEVLGNKEEEEKEAAEQAKASAEKAVLDGVPSVLVANHEEVAPSPAPEETPAENPALPSPETKVDAATATKEAVAEPVDPIDAIKARYASLPEGRFAVRLSENSEPIRSFATKEDALAFSRELAALRNGRVIFRKAK